MKNLKKSIALILLTVSTAMMLCSWSTFRNEDGQGHANVVSVKTPIDTQKGGTVWTRSFLSGSSTTSYNSSPVITESSIYIVNRNVLYELDFNGNIKRKTTLSAAMNSICHMLWQGDFLYIPLSGGQMECVQISTLTSVWKSESFGGQSLSTVYYYNGYVYAGTTTMTGMTDSTGIFYCLNALDGTTKWTYCDTVNSGGYYWSGAISYGDALYFAGDNGMLVSHSLLTDEVYDTRQLTTTGKVRAGITYDADSDSLYTASNDGKIYKITAALDGTIQDVISSYAIPGAKSANCTSTPTVWNGRLYVGSSADSVGYLSVMDASTLSIHYTVACGTYKEVKSSPLVSTGYASEENNQTVYVYFSSNALPGGIYYIKDNENSTSGKLETLYTPAKAKQFCLSSIVPGQDGTLYYSNDSGTLFAVNEVDISSDLLPEPTTASTPVPSPSAQASSTPNPQNTISKAVKNPKKPNKIKYKKKKKTFKLSWKKRTAGSQTVIYYRYNSGKWQKKIISKKNSYTIKRKKKKIYVRLRSRIKKNKKWYYSAYTKTFLLKP